MMFASDTYALFRARNYITKMYLGFGVVNLLGIKRDEAHINI